MVTWGETGVASNKNTEVTVSETEMKKGKMYLDSLKHITWDWCIHFPETRRAYNHVPGWK